MLCNKMDTTRKSSVALTFLLAFFIIASGYKSCFILIFLLPTQPNIKLSHHVFMLMYYLCMQICVWNQKQGDPLCMFIVLGTMTANIVLVELNVVAYVVIATVHVYFLLWIMFLLMHPQIE